MTPEFARSVRLHDIGTAPRREQLTATAAERAALVRRFDLLTLDALTATVDVVREAAGVRVRGRLSASGAQPCSVSRDPVPFALDEEVDLRFVEGGEPAGDEIELSEPDLDTLPIDGETLDLGEAVAQTLGLALDPYPRGSDEVRAAAAGFVISEEEAAARAAAAKAAANPFGVLRI